MLVVNLVGFAHIVVALLIRNVVLDVRVVVLVILNMGRVVSRGRRGQRGWEHLLIIVVHIYNHLFNY